MRSARKEQIHREKLNRTFEFEIIISVDIF